MLARDDTLERLATWDFDLAVIGGGIVGSRVAYDAALAGLRVVLLDAGDFGGATSSASSKLLHGGFRYLASCDLRLVREAQHERSRLLELAGPYLAYPLPLVVAAGQGTSGRRIACGRVAYNALSARDGRRAEPTSLRAAKALVPALDPRSVASCLVLPEAQTNDARLTLATVKGAARAGAVVANYATVVEIERTGRGVVAATVACDGARIRVRCRALVNAAGPWVDHVRRLETAAARPLARLSKGTHLVLTLDEPWGAAVAGWDEGATMLAMPWNDGLLLGATDTPFDGDPRDVEPTPGDVDHLLAGASQFLLPGTVSVDRVRFAFAGLRVLPRGDGDTARARRGLLLAVGEAGMVSVAGGKLTTHRRIARRALELLPVDVRPRRLAPPSPLPGSGSVDVSPLRAVADDGVVSHLARLYGSDAPRLLAYAERDGDAFERIHPAGPDVWAEARFAVDEEWARTVTDVVRRRTTLSVRGLVDDVTAARLADVVSPAAAARAS